MGRALAEEPHIDVPLGWAPVATQVVGARVVGIFEKACEVLTLSDGGGHALPCDATGHRELGIGENLTIVGGHLPPQAASVQVLGCSGCPSTVINRGAWCAVLHQPSFGERLRVPLVFRDGTGRVVRAPLPPGMTGRLVSDCSVPCPACESRTWERIEDVSAGSSDDHSPLAGAAVWVACSTCGHTERGGLIRLPPSSGQHRMSTIEVEALADTEWPVYRTADGDARVRAITRKRGKIQSVDVDCILAVGGTVSVRTGSAFRSKNPVFAARAWETVEAIMRAQDLSELLDSTGQPELERHSDAAVLLASRTRRRNALRALATAKRRTLVLSVDSRPEHFACFVTHDVWVAFRCDGFPEIMLTGSGDPDPMVLTRCE